MNPPSPAEIFDALFVLLIPGAFLVAITWFVERKMDAPVDRVPRTGHRVPAAERRLWGDDWRDPVRPFIWLTSGPSPKPTPKSDPRRVPRAATVLPKRPAGTAPSYRPIPRTQGTEIPMPRSSLKKRIGRAREEQRKTIMKRRSIAQSETEAIRPDCWRQPG